MPNAHNNRKHTSETEAILSYNYSSTKDTITIFTTEWKKKSEINWNIRQGTNLTTISNLSSNTEYEWRAQVTCKNIGKSLYSNTQTFITQCSPIISTSYYSDGLPTTRQVNWESLKTIDGYVVRWRKTGSSTWTESPSIKATTNYTSYVISGLENGNYYEFQVKAICNGVSTAYNILTQSFKAECDRDYIGQGNIGNVQINSSRISWSRVFPTQSSTEVHWRKIGDIQWTISDKLQTGIYDFKNLTPNTEYEVRLRKFCEAGIVSDFSNIATFKTLACPTIAKPTLSSNKTANSFCLGQSVVLSASGCSGTIKWASVQTGNSITVTPTDNTTYSAICESNGCASQSQNIDVKTYSPSVSISGKNEFCAGGNTTLMANPQNAIGAVSYQWKFSNANVGSNQSSFVANQAGAYIVDITDGQDCKASTSPFSIIEKGTEIVANTNPTGNVLAYLPDKILLSATLGKEYSYQWQKDKVNIAGAVNSVYEAAQSGSYAVVVTHGECSRVSEVINVRIDMPLRTSITQNDLLRIFPNPTNGFLQLETSLKQPTNIAIVDCLGNVILDKPTKDNQTVFLIDMSYMPNGPYFLRVLFTDFVQIIKVLKTN